MTVAVQSISPINESIGHYLDQSIEITFDQEINLSDLTNDNFKLWEVITVDEVEQYEAAPGLTITTGATGNIIALSPMVHFKAGSTYAGLVQGDVRNLAGSETLEANFIYRFTTGTTVSPVSSTDDPNVDIDIGPIDPESDGAEDFGSYNIFATGATEYPVAMVDSYPINGSVGLTELSRVIVIFDGDLDTDITIPIESFQLRWSMLPIDMDPFGTEETKEIDITDISVSGRQLIIDFDDLFEMENKNYTLTIAAGTVKGANTEQYVDTRTIIHFMGIPSPVYATPDQIEARLSSFSDEYTITSSGYELWKLILEKSTWVRDSLHAVVDETSMSEINRMVICLVLKELFMFGDVMNGAIKSRQLLATKVEYYDTDVDNIKKALDECIASVDVEVEQAPGRIMNGTKSLPHLDTPWKNYRRGSYR